jgi:putative N6-adenine-specific DNA methylase
MMPNAVKDKKRFRMIAKTLFGLEEILAGELAALGAGSVRPMNRSVEFYGDKKLMYRANVWCRTATRILMPIVDFRVADEKELYNKVLRIEWRKYLKLNQTFVIDAVVSRSAFDNSLYVAQKTKDAVADHFRRKIGKRPSVDLKNPDIRINIFISGNECTIALDSSGEPLFKRGYRSKTGEAPLNEVLAAGIVLHSGWDRNSPYVDAMCGSGTIVIEAAMLARNIAPGLSRGKYGFMNWPDFDRDVFRKIIREARNKIKPTLDFGMVGSDKDPKQVRDAATNAKSAGVGRDIMFKQSRFEDLIPPAPPGVLIINPPYGERMSIDNIRTFYQSIGDTLKRNFSGYDAFIFTGNLSEAKFLGLRTCRRIKLYNGPIECRLLKFEMYHGSRKSKYQKPDSSM